MGIGADEIYPYGELCLYCDICTRCPGLSVQRSAAGYYLGVSDENGRVCRITRYYKTREEAQSDLDNNTFTPR